MPEVTIAAAVSRISSSSMSQPNLFQLFHPMGGVSASGGFSCAAKGAAKGVAATGVPATSNAAAPRTAMNVRFSVRFRMSTVGGPARRRRLIVTPVRVDAFGA
jgi:hypothetical protein